MTTSRTRTEYRAYDGHGTLQGRGLTQRQAILAMEEAIGDSIEDSRNPCGAAWWMDAHEQTQDPISGEWVDIDAGTYVAGSRH